MRLEKVKNLISEGKTQQAIDLLQKILEGKDLPLLNQTFLLEGQLKELQKKMQLGLEDATTELNRINFTLLSVCDEASNLKNIGDDGPEQPFSDDEKQAGLTSNPLAIFGIIVAIGIATILGIYLLVKKPNTVVAPLPLPNATEVATDKASKAPWIATPVSVTISEKDNGNIKADVLSIKTMDKNAETKLVTLEVNFNCEKSVSGACKLNLLEFRLVSPNGDKSAPSEDVVFDNNPKQGTTMPNKISFIVPKNQKQTDFQIYYRDKKENTLAIIHLNKLN